MEIGRIVHIFVRVSIAILMGFSHPITFVRFARMKVINL
jgi:hypothetical protein